MAGAEITAANVDGLSAHFPACMAHLHRALRRDAHLKHYGRLQYSLFLKGLGLSLEEALLFWRTSFRNVTDDTFNKEYRYNVRHAYGDVGGDANRRGGGYSAFSCQRILTEHPPGPGEAHGCPYRHFNLENLTTLLQGMGIHDRAVLAGVKEDKESQKFHMACNRCVVFSSFLFRVIVFHFSVSFLLPAYPVSLLADVHITGALCFADCDEPASSTTCTRTSSSAPGTRAS